MLHIQGLGAPDGIHMSLTHHLPLHPSTKNSWDGKVPPALEEHSQDKSFLAELHRLLKVSGYQHCPSSSSRFGCRAGVQVSAESSSKLR